MAENENNANANGAGNGTQGGQPTQGGHGGGRDAFDAEIEIDRDAGRRPTSVPYTRFVDAVTQRNTLRDQVAGFEAERKAWASERAELDALRKERSAWAEERAMIGAGLTDEEDQVVARALHSRLPAKDRPAIGDWLGAFKTDPTKAPRQLAHRFQPVDGKGSGAGADAGKGAAGGLGNTRGGQRTDAPANGEKLTVEQIRAMKQEAQRSGDWSKVKAAQTAGQL